MLYSKKINNYFWILDKNLSNFWIGPFQYLFVKGSWFDGKKYDGKIFCNNLNTRDERIGIWRDNVFCYKNKNLNIEVKNGTKKFNIFVISKIFDFKITNIEKLLNIFPYETLNNLPNIEIILLKEVNIDGYLPLLNGFVNKRGFINGFMEKNKIIKLNSLTDIYEQNLENNIKELFNLLNEIKQKNILLTQSMQKEIKEKTLNILFFISKNILISYLHLINIIKNQKKLHQIINSKNILEEYKAHATLLDMNIDIKIEKFLIEYERAYKLFMIYGSKLIKIVKSN